MARRFTGLSADRVAAGLAAVQEAIGQAARRAGRDPAGVEVVAAGKYVPLEELGVLAEAGLTIIGENRAQDLEAKVEAWGERFTWDFIGQLQSRKVRRVAPLVRLIHSVGSQSALRELGRMDRPVDVLLQVNVAGEQGKAGIAPSELDAYLEAAAGTGRCSVVGLMGMPPLAERPEDNRRWFAMLRELAEDRGLEHLSMGTSQDYLVAVEEGATKVRLGTSLFSA